MLLTSLECAAYLRELVLSEQGISVYVEGVSAREIAGFVRVETE
jgi:hypothetical protein